MSGKVIKTGVPVRVRETINIAGKTTTARNKRYLSLKDYQKQVAAGMLNVVGEENDPEGNLKKVTVESTRYVVKFLRLLLASTLIYSQATKSATGAAQPTVALKPLRNFLVPLPPLPEQHLTHRLR